MSNSTLEYFLRYRKNLDLGWFTVLDVETKRINLEKDQTLFTHAPEYILGNVGTELSDDLCIYQTRCKIWGIDGDPFILVGHNIAYDMLYMAEETINNPKLMIWDTMIAEYLLTNQAERMPSLEKCCELEALGMVKSNLVSEHIKNGGCPSELPREQLEEYLAQDCKMTEALFLKQKEKFLAKSKPWQNMFINQMLFRINTFRASYNGMRVDRGAAIVAAHKLEHETHVLECQLHDQMESLALDFNHDVDWNPASVDHVHAILYGGAVKYTDKEPIGTYKTGPKAGQPKYKNVKKEYLIPHFSLARMGVKGTDEGALKEFAKHPGDLGEFAKNLLEYRDMSKTLSTYMKGYLDFAAYDGYIHPQFNHALTPTGRLTCSKPNLQNIKG